MSEGTSGRRVLGPRELNRAVLERQLLLGRAELPAVEGIERVLGLNAQSPNLPYLALWTRLADFTAGELTAAIEHGTVVRSTLLRATQHVVSAADFPLLRPAVAPLLRRVRRSAFGRRTAGVDLDALVADARELLAGGRVLTRPELGRQLARLRPGADPGALGWTVQYLEPIVHPAPSGTWNTYGPTPFALADEHLDRVGSTGDVHREATREDVEHIARRYLAAFGPATAADMRAWSGISGLREVLDGLRPRLRTYADESGRELFDLPDAPRPPEDVPAPVRFLPEFDAPLLAYADRTRMMSEDVRRRVCVGSGVAATVLVDGVVWATWSLSVTGDTAVLTVEPLCSLSARARSAVEAEAVRLLAFAAPDAANPDVRLLPTR